MGGAAFSTPASSAVSYHNPSSNVLSSNEDDDSEKHKKPSLLIRGQSFFDGSSRSSLSNKSKSLRFNIINPHVLDVPKIMDHPTVDYSLHKRIGHGAFSIVHKGSLKSNPTVKVAIKEVDTSKLNKKQINDLTLEINILSQLKHPSIVQLHAVYSIADRLFIVMEYLRGGELLHAICKQEYYSEGDARRVLYQLAQAIQFMHCRNVIHRDIKPENIILENAHQNSKVKLIDFGFAVLTSDKSTRRSAYVCGTPGYLAPEVITDTLYTTACDIWSLGVVMYILLSGTMPFDSNDDTNLLRGFYEFPCHLWSSVSSSAKDLIEKMLVVNPRFRYTIAEVLSHPWMQIPDYNSFDRMDSDVDVPKETTENTDNDLTANLITLRKLAVHRRWRLSILKVQSSVRLKKLGASFRHRVDSIETATDSNEFSRDDFSKIDDNQRVSISSNESDFYNNIAKLDIINSNMIDSDDKSEMINGNIIESGENSPDHSPSPTKWRSNSSESIDNSVIYSHLVLSTIDYNTNKSRKASSFVSDLPPVQEINM